MTPEGIARLKLDEGKRNLVYDDATGKTIERGPAGGWPTIAFGRNLSARGLTDAECEVLLVNDLAAMEAELSGKLSWFTSASPIWQDVVVMVEYNTGDVFAFPHMLAAMEAGEATAAYDELLNSKAARQGPERYQRMADAIVDGAWTGISGVPNAL